MRVLALNKAQAHAADAGSERTGVFTSGIVSTASGRDIALFFTGHQHAGENLADVLKHRAAELNAPIQMCFHGPAGPPIDMKMVSVRA
jgi:hypothetical protein